MKPSKWSDQIIFENDNNTFEINNNTKINKNIKGCNASYRSKMWRV